MLSLCFIDDTSVIVGIKESNARSYNVRTGQLINTFAKLERPKAIAMKRFITKNIQPTTHFILQPTPSILQPEPNAEKAPKRTEAAPTMLLIPMEVAGDDFTPALPDEKYEKLEADLDEAFQTIASLKSENEKLCLQQSKAFMEANDLSVVITELGEKNIDLAQQIFHLQAEIDQQRVLIVDIQAQNQSLGVKNVDLEHRVIELTRKPEIHADSDIADFLNYIKLPQYTDPLVEYGADRVNILLSIPRDELVNAVNVKPAHAAFMLKAAADVVNRE